MTNITYVGAAPRPLRSMLQAGRDHSGNAITAFVDGDGGWNLRCCLRDSAIGERIAIVAWSPFPWSGPYAECGPIVVHAQPCGGYDETRFPVDFHDRRQVVRPYLQDQTLDYDRAAIIEPGAGLEDHIHLLLQDTRIAFVHSRSMLSGCFSFGASATEVADA